MIAWIFRAVIPLLLVADAPPFLEHTYLYTKEVRGCHDVDLTNWIHPSKNILLKAGVKLYSVILCNNDAYPVYNVRFKFDPRTNTSDYFIPIYGRVARANGGRPFSFVDTEDAVIINVKPDKRGNITISYEDYRLR